MQCQVVTNSECSNYRYYFQSEIAQFPRMRSLWLENAHTTWEERETIISVEPDCVCLGVCSCVHMCAHVLLNTNSSACLCTDPGMTHPISTALDKSRNGSCQLQRRLALQLSPFHSPAACKPHQAGVATRWWERCASNFKQLCCFVIISANQGLLIY